MTATSSKPAHPAPEQPGRPATHDEIPTSAHRLAALAREHGWDVRCVYARGTRLGSNHVTDSVTVRLRRDTRNLVGLWVEGMFRCGLSPAPLRLVKSRELTAAVKGEEL